jgi:hypothetical protein
VLVPASKSTNGIAVPASNNAEKAALAHAVRIYLLIVITRDLQATQPINTKQQQQ